MPVSLYRDLPSCCEPDAGAITALHGDVVATGPGDVLATIQQGVVTNLKLAVAPALTLKGNNTNSTGTEQDLTVSEVQTMLDITPGPVTFTAVGSSPNADGAIVTSGNIITLEPANTSFPGVLLSADWNTFNNKQNSLTFGSISTSTTGVTVGGGANSTVGPNVTVNVQTASGSQPGLLSSADWTTFNNKQPSGAYITALTGDVVATGPGSSASTIQPNVVTNAKLAVAPAMTLKGNNTVSTGNEQDLTVSQVQTMLNIVPGSITFTAVGSSPNSSGAIVTSGNIITLEPANASFPGVLLAADWTTFNNKQNALTFGNLTTASANFSVSGGTGAVIGSGTSLTLTEGNLTEAASSVLVISGGTSAVLGAGTSIQVKQAGTSQSGYLSSTDWNTFNNKQSAGNYITALTGDGTATGPGSAVLTLSTVNANIGTFASVTVNGKGLVTAATALSGDATTSGSVLTLDTVNANVGSFGSSTAIPTVTVNAKGLTTAVTTNAVIAPAGTLTGTTLASNVVSSSLTSVGTITTGVWNGTVTQGFSFLTSGTSYTTPSGITAATLFKFYLVGGGGGGGGTTTANGHGAGGGGAGVGVLYITGLAPSTPYTIAIGAGGAQGTNAPSAGGAGGNTTITIAATTYTASGGGGGPDTASTSTGGVGGASTGFTINIPGQNGCGTTAAGTQSSVPNGGNSGMGFGLGGVGSVAFIGQDGHGSTGFGGGGAGAGPGTGFGASGGGGCMLVEWSN